MTELLKCSMCGQLKPKSEFHRNRANNPRGFSYNCKTCTKEIMKAYNKKHYAEQREEIKEKSRRFYREHRDEINEKRKGQFTERMKKYQRKYRKENPKIPKAHGVIQRNGKFPLAQFCELCPENDRRKATEHHHPDYDFPEIYVSVCSSCHKWVDKNHKGDV